MPVEYSFRPCWKFLRNFDFLLNQHDYILNSINIDASVASDIPRENLIQVMVCVDEARIAVHAGGIDDFVGARRKYLRLGRVGYNLFNQAVLNQNLTESQFETNLATLRHMELARGFKDGDTVRYTLF